MKLTDYDKQVIRRVAWIVPTFVVLTILHTGVFAFLGPLALQAIIKLNQQP